MNSDDLQRMQEYYNRRAVEYEQIYDFADPERRRELQTVERIVSREFVGKRVLEVACGSGYWTQLLSPVAEHITAIDGSDEMLDIAQAKNYLKPNVTFARWDAFELTQMRGEFDAALAGFWLSHVPRRRAHEFLAGLHARLKSGSVVLMCDNNLVEGMGGEIIHQPDSDDTYKRRTLSDGTRHVIVKNYFTESDLRDLFAPYAADINVQVGQWYWYVVYHTKVDGSS